MKTSDMEQSRRRTATNPFDFSSDEESSSGVFHDCNDALVSGEKREAQLDFSFSYIQVPEEPALRFDLNVNTQKNTGTFSPLESAMLHWSTEAEESEADSGSSIRLDDEDQVTATKEESQWLTVLRKASGSLLERISPKKTEKCIPEESEKCQLSRSDSHDSFLSARSIHIGAKAGTSALTRRGSFKEPGSPGGRKESLKSSNSSRTQKRTSVDVPKVSPVLQKIESCDRDSDFDSTAAPWTKMILLEELGTASSWTVLLLPYIAFIISVLLDTHSALMMNSVGPLSATSYCTNGTTLGPISIPILLAPLESCSYSYALKTGHGVLASGKSSYLFETFQFKELMRNGTVFTSGPIENIPPMSTFLHGDVHFQDLSTNVVALVARGMVLISTVILQRSRVEWTPVFVAKPEPLSMACKPNTVHGGLPSSSSLWNCSRPRIVDVIFPMPGTLVLSDGELQVNVFYSPYDTAESATKYSAEGSAPYKDSKGRESFVYYESSGANAILSEKDVSQPGSLVSHLVRSSYYVFEHESRRYATVKVSGRLLTLIFTFCFTIFWCWSLGCKGFFAGADCCCSGISYLPRTGSDEEMVPLTRERQEGWFWWESPWIVFPERRYLLVLLICLMLIQNPLLAFACFHREIYGSAKVHLIANIMTGIGVHGVLMMWLCLVQGVRYHTASFARRRAKHQRQLLDLRRAAKYLVKSENGNHGTDEYMANFFDQFGDVDGSRSAGSLAIRLKSDPFGDSWADFLLLKLLWLTVGMTAVVMTAVSRFSTPIDSVAPLTQARLHRLNALYVTGSVIQLIVMLVWVFLILRNTFLTGAKLRKEPFLSTRPAQLAYRVLLGMLILGVGALIVPLLIDLYALAEKWTLGQKTDMNGDFQGKDESRLLNILLKILQNASQRLPYSGTASSIGPGKIVFVTTIALVSAFIFLPSRPYYEDEALKKEGSRHAIGDEKAFSLALLERMRQRRDKRLAIGLARQTHTWRAFPLPIKKTPVASKHLSESSFQLSRSERSAAYFNRYIPVFCVEIACWLLEASWQAYYSPNDFSLDDWAPGRMALESIGLHLEQSIIDESLHTQAFVASNISSQVDGEEDSIIVIAFRGTASSRNMKTDLTFRQVPLFDQITGTDKRATFQVRSDRIDAYDTNDHFWDTPMKKRDVLNISPVNVQEGSDSTVYNWHDDRKSSLATVSNGAKAVIKAVPMARQALPCVHEGFLEAYAHIRRQVLESVLAVLRRQFSHAVTRARLSVDSGLEKDMPLVLPKIYITGHSLGGSLAQLLALDIASNCELIVDIPYRSEHGSSGAEDFFLLPSPSESTPEARLKSRMMFFSSDETQTSDNVPRFRTMHLQPPIAVYTYGQPRLGNHAFARLYKKRVPHTFRVACEGDAFTTMPPTLLCGWSGIYKHAGLEVMLDEGCTGNILVGPTVVETLFRFTKVRTSVAAHSMERYRDSLESALGQDELEEYYLGHGTLKQARGGNTSTALPEWLTQIKRSRSEEA